jgi:predicted RNA binding protein YcfA (HicA-like mRNA interferase family)
MNGYEKLVKEQLLKHGYKLVRTGKGSHEIWASEKGISVTVNHICKSRHTANAIMKAANIDYRF